eukprot:CAMPEP_0185569010 /NCGR_PEP_ID=MMETSP0434-20130131/1776_1 /TAXON_ID=626734 ORGANISM="Favella taraikaensis, Strain Fe Narragansett Bay" /NCGR_SAMPLE_ID=MMETSP0434 /ASSEMBLY_ACC=CAM_ASM_000379 /LENGTH=75 /DNA_ID=CAMNT_0028183671 /DNA_START=598 /DNA_END=825 /DNA_ORIENTATION=+
MAETKVAYFGDWALLNVLLARLLALLFEDEDVVHFDICVDDTALVQVPDACEDVLRPDDHLLILHGLVLAEDAPR